MDFLGNQDLTQKELQNYAVHNNASSGYSGYSGYSSPPVAEPVVGQLFYDSGTSTLYIGACSGYSCMSGYSGVSGYSVCSCMSGYAYWKNLSIATVDDFPVGSVVLYGMSGGSTIPDDYEFYTPAAGKFMRCGSIDEFVGTSGHSHLILHAHSYTFTSTNSGAPVGISDSPDACSPGDHSHTVTGSITPSGTGYTDPIANLPPYMTLKLLKKSNIHWDDYFRYNGVCYGSLTNTDVTDYYSTGYSISFKFKMPTVTTSTLAWQWAGYLDWGLRELFIGIDGANKLHADWNPGSGGGGFRTLLGDVVLPNTTVHCVVTMANGAGNFNLYQNAVLKATAEGKITSSSAETLYIGAQITAGTPGTPPYYLPDQTRIADFRVYNKILSPSEITQLYNGVDVTSGLSHNYSSLLSTMYLNTMKDLVPNTYSATFYGI